MSRQYFRLVRSVELSREPHSTTLYNCLRHYIIDDPEGPKMRVKALKVRDAFPQQRCLGKQLVESLADKWRRAQEHSHIATMEFCHAIECDLLPVLNPLPIVVLMREYENGNLLEYINRIEASYSQRAQWLFEVACALRFLHEDVKMIHGNVHPNNILIDDKGRALLTDSALYTSIRRYFGTDGILPYSHLPASLWCKPAAVVEEEFRSIDPTVYHDTFGFAVTIWIAFSGREPFWGYDSPQAIIGIRNGWHRHLKKEPGMSNKVWELISVILSQDSTEKCPSLSNLASELKRLTSSPNK